MKYFCQSLGVAWLCFASACGQSNSASFTSSIATACTPAIRDGGVYNDKKTNYSYKIFKQQVTNDAADVLCSKGFGGILIYTGQVLPDAMLACQQDLGIDSFWRADSRQHAIDHARAALLPKAGALSLFIVGTLASPTTAGIGQVMCWKPGPT